MSNYVLKRVESVKLGAVGAAEAACTDLGSIRSLDLALSQEEDVATSAAYGDAPVEISLSGTKGTVTIECEEVTLDNLAKALNATIDGTSIEFDGLGGTPAYFTLYARGFMASGDAKVLHGVKCYIRPNAGLKLGKEQQILSMEIVLLVDPSAPAYKMLSFANADADTTAPTVASVSPTDGATAVAKAASTVVAWTFSEAIRTEDVTAAKFFVTDDAGAVKAGTLSVGTNNTVVTFTPSAAWAATTAYLAIAVQGVRDTAGNALAATSVTNFTTGS